ncbi:hypothetical protein BH11CYA1_BH11CYA1_02290 [soil metagenome]
MFFTQSFLLSGRLLLVALRLAWWSQVLKRTASNTCCILFLVTVASAAVIEPAVAQSFRGQPPSNQVSPLSTEGKRLQNALYASNPFDVGDSYYEHFFQVVDSLVSVRSNLDAEVSLPQSQSQSPAKTKLPAIAIDRQVSALTERVQNERRMAFLDKIELTKRQIIFSSAQLKDDLSAALVYPSSTRSSKSTTGNRTSDRSLATLKLAFYEKVEHLCEQFKKDCVALDSLYQGRLGSVISSGEGIKQQMTSEVGSNKIAENGTTMYVRNYVNFGGITQPVNSLRLPVAPLPTTLMAVPGRLNRGKVSSGSVRPLP